MRQNIRALLQRYQQFLNGAPEATLALLVSTGPNGQPMNPKQLVDYLLERAFN